MSRDAAPTTDNLLKLGTKIERRLLKRERQAEDKVRAARERVEREEARVAKALKRLAQSRADLNLAVAELEPRRQQRARGDVTTERAALARSIGD